MPGRNVLFVEGTDDERVILRICNARELATPEVISRQGIAQLLEAIADDIPAYTEEGDVVGIVLDANGSPEARWRGVRDRLTAVGYASVPASPDPDGTVLDPPATLPLPRVGVWIMPDNQNPGNLESLLRSMVPSKDGLFAHAADVVASLPEKRFGDNELKATIHTWLAWQETPGLRYGTAITARYLDPSVPQVDGLVAWLRRLFGT